MAKHTHIEVRNLRLTDYRALKKSMIRAYTTMEDAYWREPQIKKLLEIFPEGQICVVVNNQVVGAALSIIVKDDQFEEEHTYPEITGNYTFSTHTDKGDTLYGIDILIAPSFRGLRLGRRLYDARKELCERLNLEAMVIGGRIPGYKQHANELTPLEYIKKVQRMELHDPVLSFQLANDFHIIRALENYLPYDNDSQGFATLMEWNNIYYTPPKKGLAQPKTIARLGLVQWQMRPLSGIEGLFEQLEYFIDTVSGYKCDFLLLPEYFNAPLMAGANSGSEAQAIRYLASFSDQIRAYLSEMAISYNVNIITGSMPHLYRGRLTNAGYLCRRDGTWEKYEKLHITPNERAAWGMAGGKGLRVFETDAGKVGILICYDVEFPELPRLLADQGLQILFVPFHTDTQNGYIRVRTCPAARAIENECYVAIAGSVGNLPKVLNMDIQYSQSAVFTPSDFPFPTNAVKAEATPNTETVLVVDVDLESLTELHHMGSVRTLSDRRKDLYSLKPTKRLLNQNERN